MNNREEQFVMQAAEHARLYTVYNAEADRIADEIIDRIIAEYPNDPVRIARQDEALEQALETLAERIETRSEIKTDTLPAIRHALNLRRIRTNLALTLAYRCGQRTKTHP